MRIRVKNQPKITLGRNPAVEVFEGAGAPGLVPNPVTEDGRFLRDDGTWTNPAGSGDVVGPASSVNDRIVVFNGTTGKLIKDGGQTIAQVIASVLATTTTGTAIDFTSNKIFGSPASPETGNITEDLTGAKIGVVQKIYHNHSVAPTVPAGWVLLGSGTYTTSVLNIIYAEWVSGTRVEYWIVQEA